MKPVGCAHRVLLPWPPDMLTVPSSAVGSVPVPARTLRLNAMFTRVLRLPAAAKIVDLTPVAKRQTLALWLGIGGGVYEGQRTRMKLFGRACLTRCPHCCAAACVRAPLDSVS